MPIFEHSPLWTLLYEVPKELTPLYAVLAVLHQALSGKPVGGCVLSCHQISGGLQHLGFHAEPIAACATVYRTTGTFTEISEVGVFKHPPMVRPDGTTTGHMVVWAPSFGLIVDPTLVQDPTLLGRAAGNPIYSVPVIAQASADPDLLLEENLAARMDEDLYASWLLLPQWTDLTNQVLDGPLITAATLGGLSLATEALDVLRRLAEDRDLSFLEQQYPQLAALLAGDAQLPSLPDEAPSELRDG